MARKLRLLSVSHTHVRTRRMCSRRRRGTLMGFNCEPLQLRLLRAARSPVYRLTQASALSRHGCDIEL